MNWTNLLICARCHRHHHHSGRPVAATFLIASTKVRNICARFAVWNFCGRHQHHCIWFAYHRVYLLAIVNIYTRVLRSLLKYYTCTTPHSHHIFIIIFCSRSRTCVSIYLFVMNERARAPKKTRLRANKVFFIFIYTYILRCVVNSSDTVEMMKFILFIKRKKKFCLLGTHIIYKR